MKKYLTMLAVLAVILSLLVLGAVPAAAESTVTVNSSEPLIIGGVLTTQLPAVVSAGTVVSVVTSEDYVKEGERYTFLGWSDGTKGTSITLTGSGTITALWSHEILIQVTYAVASLQQSLWVPVGLPYQLKADPSVDAGGNVRYEFQQWSGGQTPYLPDNTIVPFQPETVSAQYSKEYLLTILAPEGVTIAGSGWYTDGDSVILQAPKDIYDTAKTSRQDFSTWESIGSAPLVLSSATSNVMTVTVNGPYTLQADYNQQYLVTAVSPFGSLNRDWVTSGAEEQLSAPDTQVVVTDLEQYVFKQWTGIEGLVSPKVSGTVTSPLALTAVYEHQYKVTLVSANGGSGDGWIKAGSTTTIRVPTISQKGLFMRSRFTGFAGYSGKSNTLQVLVQGPTTITANYTTGLDLRVLGIIIGAVLVAIVLWALGKRIKLPSWFN